MKPNFDFMARRSENTSITLVALVLCRYPVSRPVAIGFQHEIPRESSVLSPIVSILKWTELTISSQESNKIGKITYWVICVRKWDVYFFRILFFLIWKIWHFFFIKKKCQTTWSLQNPLKPLSNRNPNAHKMVPHFVCTRYWSYLRRYWTDS